VKESGLRYAVHLSSYGAQVPEGTGPVAGLHSSEQRLNAIGSLNVLHLQLFLISVNIFHVRIASVDFRCFRSVRLSEGKYFESGQA
jgi:hypothetical protein